MKTTSAPPGWFRVDDLPEVRSGQLTRDQVYRGIAAGRIPHARISAHVIFVPVDWLERIARNGEQGAT